MKKITIRAMVFFIALSFNPQQASAQADSFPPLKELLVIAVFHAAISADTMSPDSTIAFDRGQNWHKVTVDSTIIMWSDEYGKVWPPGDQTGLTLFKRDGVWTFPASEGHLQDVDVVPLVAALVKLKKLKK